MLERREIKIDNITNYAKQLRKLGLSLSDITKYVNKAFKVRFSQTFIKLYMFDESI